MSLGDRVPVYLVSRTHLWGTVTFVALFSLAYTVLNVPFNDNSWFEIGEDRVFALTLSFFISSLALIILGKVLITALNRSARGLTMLGYIACLFLEMLLISLDYALLTAIGSKQGIIDIEASFWMDFSGALVAALVELGFPYLFCAMYFALNDKNKIIRVMNYSTVVSDDVIAPKDEKKITLFDYNGVLKLSLSPANLYYIESDDNYIKVWYTDSKGLLKQYMLRCRLKTVEESFIDSSLVRCNRKYIVNMDRVKVLRKVKDNYELDLDNEQIPALPITKTYEEQVLARFNDSRR